MKTTQKRLRIEWRGGVFHVLAFLSTQDGQRDCAEHIRLDALLGYEGTDHIRPTINGVEYEVRGNFNLDAMRAGTEAAVGPSGHWLRQYMCRHPWRRHDDWTDAAMKAVREDLPRAIMDAIEANPGWVDACIAHEIEKDAERKDADAKAAEADMKRARREASALRRRAKRFQASAAAHSVCS